MNDRDFKLLVREYFQTVSTIDFTVNHDRLYNAYRRRAELSKQILSELECFTKQEIESLPFKD